MPTNVTVHYAKAQEKYLNAKTRKEKIEALEEMIKEAPSHKGGENLRKELKQRLARLRQKKEASTSRKSFMIAKKGDAQVCIIGLTQSGKSTLLSKLTNAKPKISSHSYTTEKPEIGTCDYHGVKIQLIEIPSTFQPVFMSTANGADALILTYVERDDLRKVKDVLESFRINKPFIEVGTEDSPEEIKERLWDILGLIRIYCKEPGKKPEKKPMVMKQGSTVEDAARDLHNDFENYFNFARIWGSTKYPGEKVGLDYELEDEDILEVHIT